MTLHRARRYPEADTEDVSTMSIERDLHPSREQLAAFDAGQLAPSEREAIERHLADCPECGRRVDMLPEDPFVALVRASAATQPSTTTDTPEPALLGVPDALARHPRYRLLGVLGEGGMGIVYKAVHRVLDRVVAMKVLRRRFTDHPDFVERFRQEAQAVARLVHPHIALAYDAEQAGELHFLVMEHVPGMSLDRLVAQRGPLPVAEACAYVRQAALGLQHAFEHGLIHCDVKPQNLMRTPPGQIKVLDFGLVHLARDSGQEAMQPASGAFAGTPDYTAPEQARDPRRADIRADVYGLGGTLHFLLTGQPPFPGGSALQKLLAHQDRPPRAVNQFRDDVPAELLNLLESMLAKDPAERPATPAEVARALAPFAGIVEETSESPSATPSNRWLWLWLSAFAIFLAVSFAVVVVILVFVWPRWTQSSSPTDTEQETVTPAPAPLQEAVTPAPTPAPVDPLALATPEQMARLRNKRTDQALAWLGDHGRKGRQRGLVRVSAAQFAKYPNQIDAFQILLGSQWLDGLSAVLLAGNLGGFHVYPLTAEQAQALHIDAGTWLIRHMLNVRDRRRAAPRVTLSALRFDDGSRLNLGKEIAGSLAYEVHGPAMDRVFAVRLAILLDGGKRRMALQWFKERKLEGRGTLRFLCPPLGSRDFQPRGPIVVFADLCTDVEASMVVESDAAANFIDAAP
jgi:serine/threonine protein kinase